MGISVDGKTISIETELFTAQMAGARLVSFIDRQTGAEFCRPDMEPFPVEMHYSNGGDLGADKHQNVEVTSISPIAARVVLSGADSERELLVRLDEATGDLCITPSGQSARRGVLSVRWNIPFAREAALILPCINGIYVKDSPTFPGNQRFNWPCAWNAGLIIAERDDATMMVHTQDLTINFKALKLVQEEGLCALGFESEQSGPSWENRNAGGLEWRLNVYEGGWEGAADRYRSWLEDTYRLGDARARRPEWVDNIRAAICWAEIDQEKLEALANIVPPEQTLIHLASWRTDPYDVNYPNYVPDDKAKAYCARAAGLGFHVMPHFNFFSCYNDHPLFSRLQHWQFRDVYRNEPQGWYWPPETHDETRMGYIHPGLAQWRRILIDAVRNAAAELSSPAVFLDQTLCVWNTDNGLVENMTTVEGLWRMQEEFTSIQPDIVLAGEGAHEVSIQRQCFAQAHIKDGWEGLTPDHQKAAHPICSYLWRDHTRLLGYYHITTGEPDFQEGFEIYRKMGAIPTIVPGKLDTLTPDHPDI